MALGTIDTNQIASDAVTVPKVTDQVLSSRNLVINGAQNVAQRGSSFNFVHDGTRVGFITDRFNFAVRSTSDEYECTVAQVSDAPAGFSKSLKLTTTTAESAVGSDEYYLIGHPIEAQNLQHLQYGTSGALTITLSFYVKSSLTGTFGFSIYKPDNTERVIARTYTISSADTWEKKTITMAGDTSIAINNDNGGGMYFYWLMGGGTDWNSGASTTEWANYGSGNTWFQASATNNIVTTANATWQLTGVQLETGDVATPFEHEDYGTTLAKCQRFFTSCKGFGSGYSAVAMFRSVYANQAFGAVGFPTEMRATPTVTLFDGSSNTGTLTEDGAAHNRGCAAANISTRGFNKAISNGTGSGNFSSAAGAGYAIVGTYQADAEL